MFLRRRAMITASTAPAFPMRSACLFRAALAPALALLLAACGGAATVSVPDEPSEAQPTVAAPGPDTVQVVLLVSTGRTMLRDDGWTLAALGGAIERVEPSAVLVQVPPIEFGAAMFELSQHAGSDDAFDSSWLTNQPELARVVVPLAGEHGFQVEAWGAEDEAVRAARDAYFADNPYGPTANAYFAARARLEATRLSVAPEDEARWLHGAEFMDLSESRGRLLSYFAEEAMGVGGEFTVLARASGALCALLEGHHGERVVVLVDADDRYFIEPSVRACNGAELLSALDFLP